STTGFDVDLSAPGVSVYTTTMGGGYGTFSGTSASSPLTAGVAALMLSLNTSLTPAQLHDILAMGAHDLGPAGWDTGYGWGRLDAAGAINLAGPGGGVDQVPPRASVAAPANQAVVGGTAVNLMAYAVDNSLVAS